MRYSETELFDFMMSEKEVRVTDTDGKIRVGRCWARSAVANENEDEDGRFEPSLEVQDTTLYASEIEKIEYI